MYSNILIVIRYTIGSLLSYLFQRMQQSLTLMILRPIFNRSHVSTKRVYIKSPLLPYHLLENIFCTVMPTKSDSDVIFCLHLLRKTLTWTLHRANADR